MGNSSQPLAYRMCPQSIEEFIGQEHILAPGKMLYRMIRSDRISSMILFGPPGTGKTSLARMIASVTRSHFEKLNAVSAGIADIKQIVSDNKNYMLNPSGKTLLFIDEIHRFNKAQQDALLPYVEEGSIVLIGATTENPFFEVNKALISRSTVFQLYPLTNDNIKSIILNALSNNERGYGKLNISIDNDALNFIAENCNGDARVALNTLELAVIGEGLIPPEGFVIDLYTVENCIDKKAFRFDKAGENHYDNISAFIKSMRGSSADGAVFYLARALYAGEDINFIARRIVICAAEDVGMANTNALVVAQAAAEAVRMIGMPEARLILSEAAITVALSKKSNAAYLAIDRALDDVKNKNTGDVPFHLRNAVTSQMAELGYAKGYKYAHDYPGGVVEMEFLPDEVKGTRYYIPKD